MKRKPIRRQDGRRIVFWFSLLLAALLCRPLGAAEPKPEPEEEFSPSFGYVGSIYSGSSVPQTGAGGGQEAHGSGFSAGEMAQRQEAVRRFLASKGETLGPGDVAEVYRLGGHPSVIHGLLGSGDIDAATSRRLGEGRAKLVETALAELAFKMKAQGNRLGVNDFGSGEMNAKTDIDLTLYPESENISSAWLTAEFKNIFRNIARVDPAQMDVVAHRYDAVIPDWRQQRGLAEFEVKLRTGRALLKANPEAYFLEGAYVQEVMGRSVKEGAKTFRWLDPEGDRIKSERRNAAEVPQFFYRPDVRPRFAWGAAVGNWHFFNAHSGDAAAQAKYLLRSVDEGASLALKDDESFRRLKTANYADLPESFRRAVANRLYAQLSPEAREEAFLALEVARDIRARKSKEQSIADETVLKPFIDSQRKMTAALKRPDETILVDRARENYAKVCRQLLMENIMRSAQARLKDWLAPGPDDVDKGTVRFVDKNGDLKAMKYSPEMQKRLQYAAFFELMDAVELLPPPARKQLKQLYPRFSRDIEILEGIIKKRREMMLLPPGVEPLPADALEMRRRAARSVVDAYEAFSRSAHGGRLMDKVKAKARAGHAFGQAFENWVKFRMGDALVHFTGKVGYGALLDSLRLETHAFDKGLGSSEWLPRLTYVNSVNAVLTEYVKQGGFNLQVFKILLIEGLNYIPVVNMAVDIQRGGKTAATQIFLKQFIPGYGQVMLVINTGKGLVNLGGAVVFEPLKRDKILFAYQGYLDPQDAGIIFPGVRRRIESPRHHLLYPVDPEGRLTLTQRREGFYAYLSPRVHELVRRRVGFQRPEDGIELDWWKKAEEEFLPQVIQHYVFQWWNGQGPFRGFDELAVKRTMDEFFGDEIRSELTRLLIQDYLTGKIIQTEKTLYKPLMDDLTLVCASEIGLDEILREERERLRLSGGDNELADSGYIAQGRVLESMPRVETGIRITASPRVVRETIAPGQEVERIQSYGLRALVTASPDELHPGPFRVQWEIQPLDQEGRFFARSGDRELMETAAEKVRVSAVLFDGKGKPMQTASIVIPIRKERADRRPVDEASAVKLGASSKAVTEKKPAEGRKVDCGPQREAYFKRCKEMGDRQAAKNCARSYSGCALDVAGCLNAYIVGGLLDEYCGKPGYLGCVTGPLDAYLACLQQCNDNFSAGLINSFGLTPCRTDCQADLDAAVKACKAGQTPPATRTQALKPPPAVSRDAPASFGSPEVSRDRPGSDYKSFHLPAADPKLCEKACGEDPRCKAYTYVKPGHQGPAARCWLKHAVPEARPSACCISGVKR